MTNKAKHDADTIKVVINRCFGGFSISYDALIELHSMKSTLLEEEPVEKYYKSEYYRENILKRLVPYKESHYLVDNFLPQVFIDNKVFSIDNSSKNTRCHPDLIKVVSHLRDKASGSCAKLAIVEIPKDVEWEIDDYDGMERIAETHRTWA